MIREYDGVRKVCEEYGFFFERATMQFDGSLEIELFGFEEKVLPYDVFLKMKNDLGLWHFRVSYHLKRCPYDGENGFSWHYEKTGI